MPETLEKIQRDQDEILLIMDAAQALIVHALDKSSFSTETKVAIYSNVRDRILDMKRDAVFDMDRDFTDTTDDDPDYLETGRDAEDYDKKGAVA